jgi:glutaredoxin 3
MTGVVRPSVRLYSRSWCGYCFAARRLLRKLDAVVDEIDLSRNPALRRSLAEENGNWPTLPMVFIGDRFVGGYRELANLRRSGELESLLRRAHS